MKKSFTLFVGLSLALFGSQAQNNALSFDGVDDYVAVPAIATNLSTFTIEAIINPVATGNAAILNTDSWTIDADGGSVHFQTENGIMTLAVNNLDNTNGWPTLNYTPVIGQWQHIAVTYDAPNKSIKFYLNGRLVNTYTYTTMPNAKIDAARIGAWVDSRYFNGKIDEIRVWNTVRTQTEIYNNMKITIANPATATGLIAYYTFNQGTANATNTEISLTDVSATPKNGTVTNFALTGTTSNWVEGFDAAQITDVLLVSANTATLTTANSNATTLNVTSNTTWTALSSDSWLTAIPSVATTGSATLNISASAIEVGAADKTATITLSAAGVANQVITVTQTNPVILTVAANTASLTVANSNTTSVAVTSNTTWTALSSDSWLIVTPNVAITGDATLNISASAIEVGAADKTATITLSAAGVANQVITVTQTNPNILYSEDFDNVPGKTQTTAPYNFPANMSLFNVDGKTSASSVAFVNNAWVRREDTKFNLSDSCAISTSWYSPASAADDWMFTPAIVLPTDVIKLSWNAVTYDVNYRDGYQVRVLTTAPNVSNINSSTTVFETAAENTEWTNRSVDLSNYGGQTVYIGFRNNSNDMFLLLIDDIVVQSTLSDTPTSVDATEQQNKISIFPNPVKTDCTITNIPNDVTTINVYNTLGVKVKSISTSNSSTYSLNLSDLRFGTYFINLNGAKTNQTLKVIKQ